MGAILKVFLKVFFDGGVGEGKYVAPTALTDGLTILFYDVCAVLPVEEKQSKVCRSRSS